MSSTWQFWRRRNGIVWLDLGPFGELLRPRGIQEQWQDHGLGLLRTILVREGIETDLLSTRRASGWEELKRQFQGYRMLLMNVRSYNFPQAREAARRFKAVNPDSLVLVGGMHASVDLGSMLEVPEFDHICQGAGERIIADLVRNPQGHPRTIFGMPAASMADWPAIDRTLWPKPSLRLRLPIDRTPWARPGLRFRIRRRYPWPLEPPCGWGPGPVATVITSRVCPWHCAFCNENSYISNMGRRSVDQVIDELNGLDDRYGIGSVVFHDSMFFQHPAWLKEWIEKYPRRANRPWPYWAAARSDTVRQWPELFETLVRETNWNTISIGFESGSDRMLRMLNKRCSDEDNLFTIQLVNRIGDDLVKQGKPPPKFWANIILGIPGETHEDAFRTMRMLKTMRHALPSVAYYAPYPGSALGHQLIAEGKSLLPDDGHDRNAGQPKVRGVDYGFYQDLLAGKYGAEIDAGLAAYADRQPLPGSDSFHRPNRLFLFPMKNGRRKLAYGESPEDALEILGMRLTQEEMAQVVANQPTALPQQALSSIVEELG